MRGLVLGCHSIMYSISFAIDCNFLSIFTGIVNYVVFCVTA